MSSHFKKLTPLIIVQDTSISHSSSTVGLNGDQHARREQTRESDRTNTTHVVRNECNQPTPIGEDDHEQHVRPSTPGGDGDYLTDSRNDPRDEDNKESALKEESINLMDDIVKIFRRKEISKLKALSNIISILDFNPSRAERTKDLAVKHYSWTLDEVEALTLTAIKQGQHAQ